MSCFIYHNNLELYHITTMDLCDMIITLLILLHITNFERITNITSIRSAYYVLLSDVILHVKCTILLLMLWKSRPSHLLLGLYEYFCNMKQLIAFNKIVSLPKFGHMMYIFINIVIN